MFGNFSCLIRFLNPRTKGLWTSVLVICFCCCFTTSTVETFANAIVTKRQAVESFPNSQERTEEQRNTTDPWQDEWGDDWNFDEDAVDDGVFLERDFEDMSPAEQAIVIAVGSAFLLLFLAIGIIETWFLYDAFRAVPPPFQQMSPGLVWLKLIPCFNLIWIFIIYPAVSNSYRQYFHSVGIVDRGDCGSQLGIWYSVCLLLCCIPCLNYCTSIVCGPASLILLILYHVKVYGYKKEVRASHNAMHQNMQAKPIPPAKF